MTPSLIPLRAFQEEAIEYGERDHSLIWLPPGTGKSRIMLETARRLLPSIWQPSLIITLKPLRMQWVNQIKLWYPEALSMILDSASRPAEIVNVMQQWGTDRPLVCITHYDVVGRMPWIAKPPWRSQFWGVLGCDESFAIQNRKSARTRHIWHIPSRRRLAATATPWSVSTTQLWGQLRWLHPSRYASYHDWEKLYHTVVPTPWFHPDARKVTPGDAEQLKALWRSIEPFTYRRTETQVLSELPELVESYVPVPMEPVQETLYTRIARSEDIVVDLDDFETDDLASLAEAKAFLPATTVNGVRTEQAGIILPNALAVMCALMRVTSGGPAKTAWIDTWMETNETATVIIFTLFKSTARMLAQRYGARLLTSETTSLSPEERPRIIVGTLAKASTGLDLWYTNNAIFVDTAWSRIHNIQGRGRIRRLSSDITHIKNVYSLEAVRGDGTATIDRRLLNAFINQMSLIELLNEVQAQWDARTL